jgi:hypothetical protein
VTEYGKYLRREEQKRLNKKQRELRRKEKSIRDYALVGTGISIAGMLGGLFALYV